MNAIPAQAKFPKFVARLIIAICVLNLNGLLYMLSGIDQGFSIFLLLGSLYLVVKFGRAAISNPLCLSYLGAIFCYIFFASLFSIFSDIQPWKFFISYLSSALIIAAMASYFSSARTSCNLFPELVFLKTVLLAAASSVLLSDFLAGLYLHPPAASDRFSGFFGNPNEAGIVSVIAFAMCLSVPSRKLLFNVCQLALTFAATLITFSKGSILALLLVILFHCVFVRQIRTLLALLCFSLLVLLCYTPLLEMLPDLTASQQTRIDQVRALATTWEFSQETTTGRTFLWTMAVQSIQAAFPLAHGFGAFHNMVGGIKEAGVWQGCHNTYLMVLGEAGFAAFLVLVLANLKLMAAAFRAREIAFVVLYVLILQCDMLSAHNVMGLRFHNMLTGVCIGLILVGKSPAATHSAAISAIGRPNFPEDCTLEII